MDKIGNRAYAPVKPQITGGLTMRQDFHEDSARAVSEADLARRVSVSTAVLRKWRREGNGPRFLKLGRLVRYLVRDVDAWLEAHCIDGVRADRSLSRSADKLRCLDVTDVSHDD
jgi:predicted DNA-binding transcriptional regulator AlpA